MPFDEDNQGDLFSKIAKGDYSMDPSRWSNITPEAQDLVRRLLEARPPPRPPPPGPPLPPRHPTNRAAPPGIMPRARLGGLIMRRVVWWWWWWSGAKKGPPELGSSGRMDAAA